MSTSDPLILQYEDPPSCKDNPQQAECAKIPAERLFDKAVYGGISYAAQAFTGILLSYWIAHGGGKPHFDKMAGWLGPNFISKISKKTGQAAVDETRGWIVVSAMIMVGNAFLLPVKWLENRKPQIVRGINDRLNERRHARGEVISEEEHADQQTRLAQMEKEPKQTWWSLGSGRAFGLAAVYGVLWAVAQKKNMRGENLNALGENFSVKAVQDTLDAAGLKSLAKSKPVENYTRIAFYDIFYSMVSAGGLYVYSHFIRPPTESKPPAQNGQAAAQPLVAQHDPPASPASAPAANGKWGKHVQDTAVVRRSITVPSSSHQEGVLHADQPSHELAV